MAARRPDPVMVRQVASLRRHELQAQLDRAHAQRSRAVYALLLALAGDAVLLIARMLADPAAAAQPRWIVALVATTSLVVLAGLPAARAWALSSEITMRLKMVHYEMHRSIRVGTAVPEYGFGTFLHER